MSAGI